MQRQGRVGVTMALPMVVLGQGQCMNVSVPYAPQRDHLAAARLNRIRRAAQNHGFQAVVVVKVRVQAADDQVMVLVLDVHQPRRHGVVVVVVNVSDGRDAKPRMRRAEPCAAKALPNQITHRLGAVAVSTGGAPFIELPGQVFFEGDGDALHDRLL